MPKGPLNYKRQQRTVGAFIKIQLDEKYHTYARILDDAAFAFYDIKTKDEITDMKKIAALPILFIVGVYNDAVTRGRWVKIGKLPLEDHLQKLPPEFIQDGINRHLFSIYENGEIRPATREECKGLECAAVWEPEAVECRIRDHYAGAPNIWVEMSRIKDPDENQGDEDK